MVRPLSNDLRERVVAAVNGGESCRTVATRFGVAVSSVVKWSQRLRATGSVAPARMGGHRKPILDPHRAFIRERIEQTVCRSIGDIGANSWRGYPHAPWPELAQLRLAQGWSQEAFAFEADIHRTYISDLERGARNPTVTIVEKLAKALGVKAGALLE